VCGDGTLHVLGGYGGLNGASAAGNSPLCEVEVFDPEVNEWLPSAPMQQQRSYAAACVYNGRLYLCGGTQAGTYLNSVEAYDGTWHTMRPLMHARSGAVAVVLDERLYVLGGQADAQGTRIDRGESSSDPSTADWEATSPMTTLRGWSCAAELTGRLYVCGGDTDKTGYLSSVETFAMVSDKDIADAEDATEDFASIRP